jgi:hypothetical protein
LFDILRWYHSLYSIVWYLKLILRLNKTVLISEDDITGLVNLCDFWIISQSWLERLILINNITNLKTLGANYITHKQVPNMFKHSYPSAL